MKAVQHESRRVRIALYCGAVALLAGCATPARVEPKPLRSARLRGNILLIIADDIGKDKIGVYQQGDDATRPATPNIDRLAAEGVRFTNAYSNAACSPTRATLLTGRYSFRSGIGEPIRFREDSIGLPAGEISLVEMLDLGGAGYDHSMLGKWHLGVRREGGRRDPLEQGFHYSAGSLGNVRDYFSWPKVFNGEFRRTFGYVTTDTTNDAIGRANEMRQPWLLWLAYNAAHKPFHVPPANLHHRKNPVGSDAERFAAMVEALDTEIGRLLASIDPAILKNTNVIFIGDNGTPTSALPRSHHHPAKGSMHEAGINVPMLVAGPAVPPAGRGAVCDALVNSTDLYATVADIAGVDLSTALPRGRILDSHSILPLLENPTASRPIRRFAYAERFKPNGPPPHYLRQQAIRDERWKLVRTYHTTGNPPYDDRLFDLAAAKDGDDGRDVGSAPGTLTGELLTAYHELAQALAGLNPTQVLSPLSGRGDAPRR